MSIPTPPGALRTIPDGTPLTQVEVRQVGHYAKVLLYILVPAITLLATAQELSPVIIINAVIASLAVIPIYWVTSNNYLKAITAFLVAGLQAVVVLLGPGLGFGAITWQQWIGVILGGLAAAGVLIIPNSAKTVIKLVPAVGVPDIQSLPVAPEVTVGSQDLSNLHPRIASAVAEGGFPEKPDIEPE